MNLKEIWEFVVQTWRDGDEPFEDVQLAWDLTHQGLGLNTSFEAGVHLVPNYQKFWSWMKTVRWGKPRQSATRTPYALFLPDGGMVDAESTLDNVLRYIQHSSDQEMVNGALVHVIDEDAVEADTFPILVQIPDVIPAGSELFIDYNAERALREKVKSRKSKRSLQNFFKRPAPSGAAANKASKKRR